MSFREIWLDPAVSTGRPGSYEWVCSALPRVPISRALVDEERGFTFYRVFVNSCVERPPGLCLLFVGEGLPVMIEAYEQGRQTDEGRVLTLLLYCLEIPVSARVTKDEVLAVVQEAYWVEEARIPSQLPIRIEWAFWKDHGQNKPFTRLQA